MMAAALQILLGFLQLYLLAFFALLLDIFRKHNIFKDTQPRHDLVAIVTGGTGGIGKCVVQRLAKMGVHVIIGARDKQAAETVKETITRDIPHAKVDFIFLDLSSLTSVRSFVQQFQEKELPLHILVNNAAVMLPPYTQTEDGFELQFAVNYLAPFLLTQLLLPQLRECGSSQQYARVVNVSSVAHFPGRIDFDNLDGQKYYSSHSAYTQSKLAVIASTYRLHSQLQNAGDHVTVNCLNPGIVHTDLYRHTVLLPRWLRQYFFKFIWKTSDQGADCVLYAALATELEGRGGLYLDNSRESRSKAVSYDIELQQRLWTTTMKLVGLRES